MGKSIQSKLLDMQDQEYRAFICKLIPTVSPETVIGIRTPLLRAYAKQVEKEKDIDAFLHMLPHEYYEENNLHSFTIEQIKDFDRCVAELERFLPYVDNWATCDSMRPKCFQKNLEQLLPYIEAWILSDHCYTVRFAIEMLMTYYLDAHFDTKFADMVANVRSDEYYVNMMVAWYFATALAKQYEAILPYLKEERLSVWTHNKTIQKAIESNRITPAQKCTLRAMKRK